MGRPFHKHREYNLILNLQKYDGKTLSACSEVNYAFRKRESIIDSLVHCAQFEKYSMIMSG